MRVPTTLSVIATLSALAWLPAPAAPQDVQYETVTTVELPGALGTMMRLAARLGGGSLETVETTYIKGGRMRTDGEGSSTIMDLEGRRMIFLNHEAKTYQVMSFDAAVAMAQQTAREIQAAQAEQRVAGEEDATGKLSFRFAVDRPNERSRVAGYTAERFFVTLEAEGEYTPEEGDEREQAGTLVVLTDLWTSTENPAFGARSRFDEVSARHYAEAGATLSEALTAAFQENPNFQVALESSAAEVAKMEGMPVRTVTTLVGVAPGQSFDRALVTDPQPRAGAARGALGRLGRAAAAAAAGQQAGGGERAEATQSVIMTLTSEIRNVTTRSLDAQLFEIPAGYEPAGP
jgi:hypothetical protein